MQKLEIRTISGATYIVSDDWSVYRPATEIEMFNTRFQYTHGFITRTDYPDGLDDLIGREGTVLIWQAVVGDFTETIISSRIKTISELQEA